MVKSMTGFGRGTSSEESSRSFSVELKSVNHRYLDISARMPKSMISLEEKIRKIINERLNRGKVDVFITYKNYGDLHGEAVLNEALADSYYKALKSIKDRYEEVKDDISISLIGRFPDVIKIEEKEENMEEIWAELKFCLEDALYMLIEMREIEGEKLKEDIILKCDSIKNLVDKIEIKAPKVVKEYKIKLEERIKELSENITLDDNRISVEVAFFADKASIDEEITRLNSHIIQVKDTLELNEPIGRKLDFIVQEMNREANTIASKSQDLEITNMVLNIKNHIEKIREQVQNLE
ncbi:YicC/YloC family endoribonuclease [Clostridium sp.]|uniref:YicC/YloC family endoribonuclease n=1 Tax=Clostridium sp. TaxID=1506 RepID=UPI0034638590